MPATNAAARLATPPRRPEPIDLPAPPRARSTRRFRRALQLALITLVEEHFPDRPGRTRRGGNAAAPDRTPRATRRR